MYLIVNLQRPNKIHQTMIHLYSFEKVLSLQLRGKCVSNKQIMSAPVQPERNLTLTVTSFLQEKHKEPKNHIYSNSLNAYFS